MMTSDATKSNSDVEQIIVPLGERTYPIRIRSGQFDAVAGDIATTLGDLSHAIVISDESVRESWAVPLASALRELSFGDAEDDRSDPRC